MNLRRTRSLIIKVCKTVDNLCIKMCKTVNNLNSKFMKKFLEVGKTKREQREQFKLNREMAKSNQFYFGTKGLRIQGPRVWNALSFHM